MKLDFKNMDKKKKILLAVLSGVVAIVIALAIIISVSISNKNNYDLAKTYYSNCKYEQATNLFKKLGNYKDSKEMYVRAYSYYSGDYKGVIILDGIKDFVIPDGATEIKEEAFLDCKNLLSVEIPESVTTFNLNAFLGCSALNKVNYLGDINTWATLNFANSEANPVSMGRNLYINGQTIGDVKLTNVDKISSFAFYNCSTITSIEIPETVTSIGEYAFRNCNFLKKVNFLGDINSWAEIDFKGYYSSPTACSKNLYLNNQLVENVNLTTAIKVPIGAFENCTSIVSLVLGDSVKEIGENAFSGCTSIANMTLSNGLEKIGESAFNSCSSLTEIIIPDSVTFIGFSSFRGCSSLITLTIPFVGERSDGSTKTHFGYMFGMDSVSYNGDRVPASLKTVIITSATSLGQRAFYECRNIKNIVIPKTVLTIGDDAFYKCPTLTIYTELESKPIGWSEYWNSDGRKVVWEYDGEELN